MKTTIIASLVLATTSVFAQNQAIKRIDLVGKPEFSQKKLVGEFKTITREKSLEVNDLQEKAKPKLSESIEKLLKLSSGSEGVGGGDEVGIRFQGLVAAALSEIQTHDPEDYTAIKAAVETSLARARFLVVDDALALDVKDLIQNSIAVNHPESGLILINRVRLNQIADTPLEGAIALHEVLSLAKLEQTGSYRYSAKYLARRNGSAAQLKSVLAVNRFVQIEAEQPSAAPHAVLKAFFDEAILPASLDDFEPVNMNDFSCQAVSTKRGHWDPKPIEMKVAKGNFVIRKAKPDGGPLFPGSPEVVRSMPAYFNGSEWIDKDNYLGSSLLTNGREMIWEIPKYFQTKILIRKNNGMVTFFGSSSTTEPPGSTEVYGYCYRNKN